ncbi:DNA-binding protein [Diplocarpon rosae]|nr:DNA-binding protein [Diplocarpon rosae]
MLLPSAIGCDSSIQTPTTRYQSALFTSPPLSPPASSSRPAMNLYSTCRALQSMLTTPNQLPSPPTVYAEPPSSPMKLRLRTRKGNADTTTPTLTPQRITKRHTVAPRALNKRTRAASDDTSRSDIDNETSEEDEPLSCDGRPCTPKRTRFAPDLLPRGLERSDFHDLRRQEVEAQSSVLPTVESFNAGEWSTDEDRLLVELVLEKLKLTKSDWHDCARSLGKDRGSVGRRWKSLMSGGEVGLKRNLPRRAKIHGTWR